ncbi:MAG: endonuclease MutS2, partial [Gemmatimonadales bacterium]
MMIAGSAVQDNGVPVSITGTPFPLPDRAAGEALAALEFSAVLDRVAAHAAGELGAAAVRARVPSGDVAWIAEELALVGEAMLLLETARGVGPEPVPDLSRSLARLRVEGSVLEGMELASLRQALGAARLVAAELRRIREDAPRLGALERPLPDRKIEKRLEQSLDSDGNLLDGASPKLAAARKAVQTARERLIRKLEALLRSVETGGEGAVTVRNGRYVIPLRRDARHRPAGIVHDESASGGTLFVEPTEAIELGNALREAEAAEDRERLKVLRDLTDLVRPEREVVSEAHRMCVAVDDVSARAKYAVSLGGRPPQVSASPGPLRINQGRHPLLCDGPVAVVPFDLILDAGERTLLISGPNTGGKTVLLKAVGLLCLMAQSGVVPPVGPESTLPVFHRFFADIGDRQSIAASLSTFSAHVQTLRRILAEADDTALVLLDEIGSGTDPAEGGALAAAALVSLNRRGTVTLASTHLGSLKELAAGHPGIVNASLEFDAATLSPTYRFLKGLPGRSYGLAIARRLGVPEGVLAEAEARIPDTERHLDAVLAAAEQRERELRAREAVAEERAAGLEALARRLASEAAAVESRETELRKREREAERLARKETRAYLLQARRRVEEAIQQVKTAEEDASREARRQVEEAIQSEARALADAEAAEAAETVPVDAPLLAGQRVRLATGTTGRVQEVRSDGRIVVVAGAVRMVLDPSALTPIAGEAPRLHARAEAAGAGVLARAAAAPSEIDLRGMTGEEAAQATIAAVDAAILADRPFLRIIHGMGTGVVRERVHRAIAGDRRIAKYD